VRMVCEEMIPRAAGTAVETRHIASQRSDSTWHAASQKTGRTRRTTVRVPVKQETGQAPSPRWTSRLGEFVDVFLERGAFTSDEGERIFAAAKQHGLGIRAHVCQLSATIDQWLAQMAKRFDIASFDHLDCVREGDIAALAKLNTMCTLLPGANYFLGLKEYPPARKLIDAGAPVALATDYNPGTSPTLSMPMVLSLACTQMKMSPAEAVAAATINGACALRLQRRKGSVAPGKDADLAILGVRDYREIAYWFGVNRCRGVVIKGKYVAIGAAEDRSKKLS